MPAWTRRRLRRGSSRGESSSCISADPCSVTVIRYTAHRPFLLRLSDTGDLTALIPPPPSAQDADGEGDEGAAGKAAADAGDAVVGGSTGTS